MKLWLAKRGKSSLIAADGEAQKVLCAMAEGECALFEVQRPRSVRWHRMYFALCRDIGENQDPPRDASSIDAELRIRAGHFDVLIFDGLEVRVPKRIAFAEMSGDQWEEFWQKAEQAIREHFGDSYIDERQRA